MPDGLYTAASRDGGSRRTGARNVVKLSGRRSFGWCFTIKFLHTRKGPSLKY